MLCASQYNSDTINPAQRKILFHPELSFPSHLKAAVLHAYEFGLEPVISTGAFGRSLSSVAPEF